MGRMVGGTAGPAVMGALVTTIGRSTLDSRLPQLPAAAHAKLASALLALWLIGPVRTQPAETRPSEQRAPEAVRA
jgi:hypothetical protein